MLARDTKIYKDSYVLTREVFAVTKKIKTEYRASIARRLEDLSIELSMRIVEANLYAPNSEERMRVLGHDFIVSYEQFFYLLSLAFDLKFVEFPCTVLLNPAKFAINDNSSMTLLIITPI